MEIGHEKFVCHFFWVMVVVVLLQVAAVLEETFPSVEATVNVMKILAMQ